jgi:hypothetical protein
MQHRQHLVPAMDQLLVGEQPVKLTFPDEIEDRLALLLLASSWRAPRPIRSELRNPLFSDTCSQPPRQPLPAKSVGCCTHHPFFPGVALSWAQPVRAPG